MAENPPPLVFTALRTADFRRSVAPVAELLGIAPGTLDPGTARFQVVVDADGIGFSPAPSSFRIGWDRIARMTNDWVRDDPSSPLGVLLAVLQLPGESEANASVLAVLVRSGDASAELRITLLEPGRLAGEAEARRPRRFRGTGPEVPA